MLGAIAGDVIGSVYEGSGLKSKIFPLFSRGTTFTDDTVLTVAVADVLVNDGDYVETYKRYYRAFPDRGFGASFARWAASPEGRAYGSYGNGAAMRVSPVAWARDSLDEVLDAARRSSAVTHDHAEGIKGAQATAAASWLARNGESKPRIRKYVEDTFGYDLGRRLDDIRPHYVFDVSCQGSVPESLICFLESDGFEDALRNAISLGGDSDTMSCIAGGIAEAYYGGVPAAISDEVTARLPDDFLDVMDRFQSVFAPRA